MCSDNCFWVEVCGASSFHILPREYFLSAENSWIISHGIHAIRGPSTLRCKCERVSIDCVEELIFAYFMIEF